MADRKRLRRLGVLLCVGVLAGCGIWTDYDQLRGLAPRDGVGNPFTRAMAREYRDLALFEADQMNDWSDASLFTSKSLASAQGGIVMPEYPDYWGVPLDRMGELNRLRAQLSGELDRGARARSPALAAKAQARFDCWIEQLEEGWQTDHIAQCETEFRSALKQLSRERNLALVSPLNPPVRMARKPAATKPVQELAGLVDPPPRAVPLPPRSTKFEVPFDFDQSMYRAGSENVIRDAWEAMRQLGMVRITVAGHADRAGPRAYNKKLSRQRAEMVRKLLITFGVEDRLIDIEAHGEERPKVATPDGKVEPANRRVEIHIE